MDFFIENFQMKIIINNRNFIIRTATHQFTIMRKPIGEVAN